MQGNGSIWLNVFGTMPYYQREKKRGETDRRHTVRHKGRQAEVRERERQRQKEEEEEEKKKKNKKKKKKKKHANCDKNRNNNNNNKTTIKVDPQYPPNLTSISPRVYRGGGRHNRQIGTPVSTTARAQVGNLAPCFHLTHVLHGYYRPSSTTATTKRFQSPRYRTVTNVHFRTKSLRRTVASTSVQSP